MVDRNDLARANQLYREANDITQAVRNFGQGGRIVSMTVSPGTPPEPPPPPEPPDPDAQPGTEPEPPPAPEPFFPAIVATGYIEYPAQMVEAIAAALAARLGEINNELAGIGVTGLDMP